MKKIRIAMIGAGNIANTHLESYKRLENAEVVAICDINPSRLKETADLFGIEHRYTSVEEMLAAHTDLDAADVCVWNCAHASCTIAALNAGLHVLCEKPMAYNTEEAIAMKEAAEKNGKILMIGFVTRFSPEARIVKDFIDKDYLGEIYYAKGSYVRRHGAPGGWFCDKARSGGGPVIDLGVHVIDRARYLMGRPKPVSVYATTFAKLGKRDHLRNNVAWFPKDAKPEDVCDVEDLASAMIRFENGAVMQIEVSFSLNGESRQSLDLYGTKGGMQTDRGDLVLYTETNDFLSDIKISKENLKDMPPLFDAEMAHFLHCVETGTPSHCSADDGIEVMKILDAIYESARTGHEVILK